MMAQNQLKMIVISASSDIGAEICKGWCEKGCQVFGTYRTKTPQLIKLEQEFPIELIHCDLSDRKSVEKTCKEIITNCPEWDILVFASGNLEPVGLFETIDFDLWEESIQINLLQQLRILHYLLPYRNKQTDLPEPCILFFAGGGSNGAVLNYSSYALSKIALTKMCEFLDAEISDSRFVIVGPGWVKTKIHSSTLNAGMKAGENYQKTLEKLEKDEFTSMQDVVECCEWLITTPSKGVKGRNFSVAFDKWGSAALEEALEKDGSMYKLRRFGNNKLVQLNEECGKDSPSIREMA